MIREQMFCLAQVFRRMKSANKEAPSLCGTTLRQRLLSQREERANVLAEDQSFTTLPGLEMTVKQHRERLLELTGLIEQRGPFHSKVIAGIT